MYVEVEGTTSSWKPGSVIGMDFVTAVYVSLVREGRHMRGKRSIYTLRPTFIVAMVMAAPWSKIRGRRTCIGSFILGDFLSHGI